MRVDCTDLNRTCPKESYVLSNIDKLVDNSSKYKLLLFMDVYYGYNQIPISRPDRKKMTFINKQDNYQYNGMPFILKNIGTKYQRMINKVFGEEIGYAWEVYIDDTIVKSGQEEVHDQYRQ